METCGRLYPERLSGISSEKRNNLTMTRRLSDRDLDPSWSLELGELEKTIERYGVRRVIALDVLPKKAVEERDEGDGDGMIVLVILGFRR